MDLEKLLWLLSCKIIICIVLGLFYLYIKNKVISSRKDDVIFIIILILLQFCTWMGYFVLGKV